MNSLTEQNIKTGRRVMALASILDLHHVAFRASSDTGKLEAFDQVNHKDADGLVTDCSRWIDVTNMSVTEMYRWLGY